MSTMTTTPAIYVGTYHKYNCGSIFGKWFDLTEFDSKEDFIRACYELHAGEHDPELMFQDREGIPSQFASESSVEWSFVEGYRRAEEEGRPQHFSPGQSIPESPITTLLMMLTGAKRRARRTTHTSMCLSTLCCLPFPMICAAISTTRRMRATCSAVAWCSSTATYSATD